jgi:hypothetical protein
VATSTGNAYPIWQRGITIRADGAWLSTCHAPSLGITVTQTSMGFHPIQRLPIFTTRSNIATQIFRKLERVGAWRFQAAPVFGCYPFHKSRSWVAWKTLNKSRDTPIRRTRQGLYPHRECPRPLVAKYSGLPPLSLHSWDSVLLVKRIADPITNVCVNQFACLGFYRQIYRYVI